VHALLAKPLDWCVIQLARRSVSSDSRPPLGRNAPQPAPLQADLRLPEVTKPADFACSADGPFRFPSPVRTASERNNLVHGRLYATGGDWMNRPTVVLLHGWNAEWCYRWMFPFLAKRLRRWQTNTATLELPYHLHRRPLKGPVRDFISSDLAAMLEATRQAVADVQSLCRWLESQGAGAVGLWGFSLGAWLAGLTASVEPGLAGVVLTTPIASIERAITELPFCAPVRRSLEGKGIDLSPLNLWSRRLCLAPENLLLMESRHDLFAPPETTERLWQAWGQPEIWRLAHGHISALLSWPVMERAARWMSRRLAGPQGS
jgi:pimeloyl-ACP methyl ester carboxylesterase